MAVNCSILLIPITAKFDSADGRAELGRFLFLAMLK